MEDSKIKHLEMIQNIITRMNSNSFQVKEWVITIVSALIALYANSNNTSYIFVGLVPTVLFWYLDAYYLQQERKFRGLYNDVLSDNYDILPFSMPIEKYEDCKHCIWSAIFSRTIGWFYGIIFALLLIGGVILKYKDCVVIAC